MKYLIILAIITLASCKTSKSVTSNTAMHKTATAVVKDSLNKVSVDSAHGTTTKNNVDSLHSVTVVKKDSDAVKVVFADTSNASTPIFIQHDSAGWEINTGGRKVKSVEVSKSSANTRNKADNTSKAQSVSDTTITQKNTVAASNNAVIQKQADSTSKVVDNSKSSTKGFNLNIIIIVVVALVLIGGFVYFKFIK